MKIAKPYNQRLIGITTILFFIVSITSNTYAMDTAKTVDSASIAMEKINNKLTNNSCQEVDIIFILDRSQSIDPGTYNNAVKQFVLNISNRFTFEDEAYGTPNFARIGVIQFTDTADITIPLQNTLDRNTFNQEVISEVVYQRGGDTKISVGLNAAYQEFINNPRTQYLVAILMTDGVDSFENDINDTATIEAARRLETIVMVFMGVGIGDEGSMNMENLTALLGNKTQYAYDNLQDAYNVSFGVAPEIAMAYPCPAIVCKGVLFVEEMTEIVGPENKIMFLEATLGISKIIHSIDSETQFGLVLFNNVTIPNNPTDYDTFITIVNNYLVTERQNNTPEAGLTYTAGALQFVKDYLTRSSLKKNFVIVMGQTYKIDDSYPIAKSLAVQLAPMADFYVVDTTDHNYTQEDVFYALINNNFKRYINDTNYARMNSYQIVDAFNKSLVLDINNYNCTSNIGSCPNGWLNSTVDPKKCYKFISYNGYDISKNQTWDYANANCQLLEMAKKMACQMAFIGIRKNNSTGQWAWSNGDPSKYRNWAPGSGESSMYYAGMNCYDGTWYGRYDQNNNENTFVDSYICQLVL
uniref:Uncharacterized protein n=1 Tax=Acrobeloides nanus TaxID=290746 RepID=A0A914E260_9BILA